MQCTTAPCVIEIVGHPHILTEGGGGYVGFSPAKLAGSELRSACKMFSGVHALLCHGC